MGDLRVGNLASVFAPRGIAVIGASIDPDKMGSVMARSLAAFGGPVVKVNERGGDSAAGLFRSVSDGMQALGVVDLAILCVPAPLCAGALDRAADAGVRGALVCAGGFAEAGHEGERAQADLLEVARRHHVRVLGPNTSGFFVPGDGLFATFVPGALTISAGNIGLVAASGGVNHALAFLLQSAGHGVRLAVGLGNAIDVGTAEVISHLAQDDAVHAIAVHLESVDDGPALVSAVRDAARSKPVVVLVVGRADVGDFARSHTGALATAWRTTCAVLAQAGAVVVDDERELVDAVTALSSTRLDPHPDPGVALVTAQAGPGLLVMDSLRHHGVRLPELSTQTQEHLGALLPPITFQANPVDTGRPSDTFADVIRTAAHDPSVDLVALYALTEPGAVDLSTAILAGAEAGPLVAGVGGTEAETVPVRGRLLGEGIAVSAAPTGLAASVRALVTDARQQHRLLQSVRSSAPTTQVNDLIGAKGAWDEHEAKQLLGSLGIQTPRGIACDNEDEARRALDVLCAPLAVKLLDATVLHKTEVGGVHLGVSTPDDLDLALRGLRDSGAHRFLLEEMSEGGLDLIVGARRDPVFGPVVLFGLGGTVAEALADVSIRAAPLSVEEARNMPSELSGRQLLQGWRGAPRLDSQALADIVVTLGDLLTAHPELDEVEINPLRLSSQGLVALDAVITTRSNDAESHH
jgi:acyl-CoA synthetase (NDP forming)